MYTGIAGRAALDFTRCSDHFFHAFSNRPDCFYIIRFDNAGQGESDLFEDCRRNCLHIVFDVYGIEFHTTAIERYFIEVVIPGGGFLPESKSEVRKAALAVRSGLPENEVIYKSGIICDKIIKSGIFARAGLILCYMDFRNEVKTGGMIRAALCAGKRVGLPLVKKNGMERELLAYEIKDPDKDVQKGTYGILEPLGDKLRRVDAGEIDLVIVPGAAFDVHKQRLGYGAGYYDRFLQKIRPDCVKMGVAFDIQIMDTIPVETHDIKMDMILTESRIL